MNYYYALYKEGKLEHIEKTTPIEYEQLVGEVNAFYGDKYEKNFTTYLLESEEGITNLSIKLSQEGERLALRLCKLAN